jgi:hypothetical protein
MVQSFLTSLMCAAALGACMTGVVVRHVSRLEAVEGRVIIPGCSGCSDNNTFVFRECHHAESNDPCNRNACLVNTVTYQNCTPTPESKKDNCDVRFTTATNATQETYAQNMGTKCGDVYQPFSPVVGFPSDNACRINGYRPGQVGKCFLDPADCGTGTKIGTSTRGQRTRCN